MAKLNLPDGEQLDGEQVEARFAQAMSAPEPGEPQAPAPQRKDTPDQDAGPVSGPAVAGPQGDGRHSKARTRAGSAGGRGRGGGGGGRGKSTKATAGPPPLEGMYIEPVTEWLEALSIGAAVLPLPASEVTVRVRLQGQLVGDFAGGLAYAIDGAARHNETIRRRVESLTMGSAGWVLPAVLAIAPFVASSAGLWRAPLSKEMVDAANAFQAATVNRLREQHGGTDASAGAGSDARATA